VYLIEEARVRRVNVEKEVERDFKKHYKCMDPEEPNIAGLKWIHDSRSILLIAEVPPHSSCPEMGKLMGYTVSVPNGKILEQFTQQRLRTVWKQYLGPRLRQQAK
jgi:hypothetical protein